jgi:hypothetical protein
MTGIIAQNVGRTSGLIKAASGGGGGVWTKIKEITASADSEISFVDGTDDVVLDSTYPIYLFKFINIHPENDGVALRFNLSADSGSNYNVTKTTTLFRSIHNEDDSTSFGYRTGEDQAQSTAFQDLHTNSGNDNDQCMAGTLHLFNPSSTTFVKHFMSRMQSYAEGDWSQEFYMAGYGNTTSAVDAIRFQMASGNIDAGTFKLYGIGDS